MASSSSHFTQVGTLTGHEGWVTSIATTAEHPNMIITGSRDRKVMLWDISRDPEQYGVARKSLQGHSHFIEEVVVSSDGQFALSCSWDRTMRLWDLNAGITARRFVSHTNDVLSVAFSFDNRQIVSGSRDRTIKLWNTLAQCKYTISDGCHDGWVSCVRFSPKTQTIVSGGWDKMVKVWDLSTCKLKVDLPGHRANINTVTVSPDGSLCASGGKDGTSMLWDLNEGKYLYELAAADENISALSFSPDHYWLCTASSDCIRIWDLESKTVVDEIRPVAPTNVPGSSKKKRVPQCMSLAWSADGSTLYSGYTDNVIRVWQVVA